LSHYQKTKKIEIFEPLPLIKASAYNSRQTICSLLTVLKIVFFRLWHASIGCWRTCKGKNCVKMNELRAMKKGYTT
jgi:hypothetical protein